MTRLRFLTAVALLGAFASADARAQSTAPSPSAASATAVGADARWAPWLGCWRAVDDPAGSGARLCVTASGGGVTLRTIVAGQTVSEESRVADGMPRPVRETGCTGTETTTWSADGHRAYRTAQAACAAESPRRLASVSFFVPGPVWVDVQTVTADGATNVRVSRHARASNQRLSDGTLVPPPTSLVIAPVSRGWTTDEIMEASRVLPPDGVQAAIGEGPTAFRLNARSLVQMADGGVAENVIDLMVALTYPEKFVVERSADRGGFMGSMVDTGWADPFFSQIVGPAALYNCYSPYGWASASYWSGCSTYGAYGYQSYPGYYSGYYGNYYGGWITTQGPSAAPGGAPQAEGRLVNGRGYTQVRPVDTSIAGAQGGGQFGGTSTTSSTSSSGGTSSSGATSSGYSGGGGGGGGGDRVAVPRPPGL